MKNVPEFSDKIYNPYNKAPQKCRIFWQVWIGEIGKKDYQNVKRIKKNSKRWNLWRILDFKYLYFFKKHSMIFQNSLIKSLIYKIKKVKISRISWQLQIDEIVNKMSKIIKK